VLLMLSVNPLTASAVFHLTKVGVSFPGAYWLVESLAAMWGESKKDIPSGPSTELLTKSNWLKYNRRILEYLFWYAAEKSFPARGREGALGENILAISPSCRQA